MPVYNSSRYLSNAIESILNQTYEDFEFLIFDDGSTDNSREIIDEFSRSDSRIKTYFSETNHGHIYQLNLGLQLAAGEFIARMDADDIAINTRFEIQRNYLLTYNEVKIVGSAINLIGDVSMPITQYFPVDNFEIKALLYFGTCMAHPSIMFKRELIDRNIFKYSQNYYPAEDYYLWTELSLKNVVFSNLILPLLHYRISCNQVSQLQKYRQSQQSINIRLGYLKKSIFIKDIHYSELMDFWNDIINSNNLTIFFNTYLDLSNIHPKTLFKKSILKYINSSINGKIILTNDLVAAWIKCAHKMPMKVQFNLIIRIIKNGLKSFKAKLST